MLSFILQIISVVAGIVCYYNGAAVGVYITAGILLLTNILGLITGQLRTIKVGLILTVVVLLVLRFAFHYEINITTICLAYLMKEVASFVFVLFPIFLFFRYR